MSKAESPKENLNMRALLIAHGEMPTVERSRRLLEYELLGKADLEVTGGAYAYADVTSEIEPPSQLLRSRVSRKGGKYVYRVHFADVQCGTKKALLIAAPLQEIIPGVRPKIVGLMYGRCDLPTILNNQFRGSSDPNVSVTRLYARVYGEDKSLSIALYGEQILSTKIITDICGKKLLDEKEGPFVATTNLNIRLEANACRLTWNDGTGKTFGLNTDRFGNYSFFLRAPEEFRRLIQILGYAKGVNGLPVDIDIDPLKRSAEALKRIAQ